MPAKRKQSENAGEALRPALIARKLAQRFCPSAENAEKLAERTVRELALDPNVEDREIKAAVLLAMREIFLRDLDTRRKDRDEEPSLP
nr:hypothetical protein REQ54_04327 [Rhizobium sp. Q54]